METVVLKVNLNCHGCRQRVKKVLKKIEGVYAVSIDAENQKVMVRGTADSATLIKKLARTGKHAELWLPKSQQQDSNKELSSAGKTRNKNQQHPQNNNSSRGVVSTDQFMNPNVLQDGVGSFRNGWGFHGQVDNEMLMAAQQRENPYMGSSGNIGNMITGDGHYENDIGAMISMMGIHGHPDHYHQKNHHHHNGYDMSGSFGSGRNRMPRIQNYPTGSRGYGNGYQLQTSPLMVENFLSPQYNPKPISGWPGANSQRVQALVNNNNMMHDGYGQMYYQY